jgi:bifunctional UDP-N-acetylglucosamine pyrophosphorylase/glucosamine-1-phosphate N-acetyltransferase
MHFSVVILAAGKGTRMKSDLPKVLHPIANKPMVQHIIDTVKTLGADNIHLVYGHGRELLQAQLSHNDLSWCLQDQQLGTGHAVQRAVPYIRDDEDILILVGDAPLIKRTTLLKLIDAKQNADLALLTVELDDPTGMGRIVREGRLVKSIIEHKDANDEQRQIKETNTGMMIMSGRDLKRWLAALSNKNVQGEYYLTDVIEMAVKEGKRVHTAQPTCANEVQGINDRTQLALIEEAYQFEQQVTNTPR